MTKWFWETKENQRVLTVMDFAPQQLDLNPAEHLWGQLKTIKHKRSVTTQDALWIIVRLWWITWVIRFYIDVEPCQL